MRLRARALWIAACGIAGDVLAQTSDERYPVRRGEPAENEARRTTNFLGLDAAPLEGAIVTDRPDFTESASAVPRGRAQLETGYTHARDRSDGVRRQDHTYPEMLWRIGLAQDVELRLGWLGWSHQVETSWAEDAGRRVRFRDVTDGANDATLGLKMRFCDQDGPRPALGMIVEAAVPTGSRSQTSGDVDPGAKLLWSYELTETLALAGNVNVAAPTSEDERFFQSAASISLGVSLTDNLAMFAEYFGIYSGGRNRNEVHFANAGFTYLLTDDVQLDIRAGVGLNDEADDLFLGAGTSFRF